MAQPSTELRKRADELITAGLAPMGFTQIGKNAWSRQAGPEVEHRVNAGVIRGGRGGVEFTIGSVGLYLPQVEDLGIMPRHSGWSRTVATVGISCLLLGAPLELESDLHVDERRLERDVTASLRFITTVGVAWLNRFLSLDDVRRALAAPEWMKAFGTSGDRREALLTAIVALQEGRAAGLSAGRELRAATTARHAHDLDHVLAKLEERT